MYPLLDIFFLNPDYVAAYLLATQQTYYRPSDRVRKKNGKLCGNLGQYYAEESDDYAEKKPDYAEISKINKVVPLAFSNV